MTIYLRLKQRSTGTSRVFMLLQLSILSLEHPIADLVTCCHLTTPHLLRDSHIDMDSNVKMQTWKPARQSFITADKYIKHTHFYMHTHKHTHTLQQQQQQQPLRPRFLLLLLPGVSELSSLFDFLAQISESRPVFFCHRFLLTAKDDPEEGDRKQLVCSEERDKRLNWLLASGR